MQPKAILTLVYYIIMILTLIVAMIGYRMAMVQGIQLDPESTTATTIYTLIILYVLLSIPYALRHFHQKVKTIDSLPNDGSREKFYIKQGIIRLSLVGAGLIISIFAFFLLRQNSLMWLAGITAIALIFCRPNPMKIEADINPNTESEEDNIEEDNKA